MTSPMVFPHPNSKRLRVHLIRVYCVYSSQIMLRQNEQRQYPSTICDSLELDSGLLWIACNPPDSGQISAFDYKNIILRLKGTL